MAPKKAAMGFMLHGEEDKTMKGIAALTLGAGLAVVLAACGAGHPAPRPVATATTTVTSSPQAVSASGLAGGSASTTTMNERSFVDGISGSIPVIPSRVVAGAVMRAYAQFEMAYGSAWGAVGQPNPSSSVTQIGGGFKLCWPDTGDGSGCDTFTQFTVNHAGQITGVSVNGQPVVGRIATAPAVTSGGLRISGVVAYQLTGAQNVVAVAFKLTDIGYNPVNTSPALLASLGGASDDTSEDALPATLAPGDTLYASAGFDINQLTGQFCLQPNDGFGEHLPCTTLTKA